jgi:hypothetical protein
MAGLFDNFDSNNLMSLGGMLLSAGAPSTQGVGERLGAGFQQYAAQQKQAGMQALQKKYLEGQISAQQLAAETAKLENRLKQQDLDIYNQYAPNSSSPQIPSTPPMPGQPPMPLGSLPSGGAPMPIGQMPQGTAGPIGPAQMGPRANLPGLQPPQGQGLPPMPPQYPAWALAGSSKLRALQEANMKQYEAQRQRVLDMAALGKDKPSSPIELMSPTGVVQAFDANRDQNKIAELLAANWRRAPTRQETGEPDAFTLGKSPTNAAQTEISSNTQALDRIRVIESLYEPEFLTYKGRAMGEWATFMNKMDPEERSGFQSRRAAFLSSANRDFLTFRKWATGVSGGEKEMAEIKRATFSEDDSPQDFEAKLATTKSLYRRLNARLQSALKAGIEPVEGNAAFQKYLKANPLENIPTLKQRGDELSRLGYTKDKVLRILEDEGYISRGNN